MDSYWQKIILENEIGYIFNSIIEIDSLLYLMYYCTLSVSMWLRVPLYQCIVFPTLYPHFFSLFFLVTKRQNEIIFKFVKSWKEISQNKKKN
jgi:hypothetical protein